MSFLNFGLEQLQKGLLDNMLEKAGIDDVGSFVQQFRNEAEHEAEISAQEHESIEENEDVPAAEQDENQEEQLRSFGGSLFNRFTKGHSDEDGGSGGNTFDMIQGAMKAYKMFSGDKNEESSSSSGGFFDNISSTVENAQKMYAIYKQFDKNGDGKITSEDIDIFFQELGLGFVSPFLAKALFQAVDQNKNGTLDFTDLMALVTILNKLNGQFGGASE